MVDHLNRISKKIRVSFFDVEATEKFFREFVSSFVASKEATGGSRILNLRDKKHLIKAAEEYEFSGGMAYAVAVVRERNTWQAKATSNGKISGISLNQGIIGDTYFFLIAPEQKKILGFTSGPSGSLRGVAKTVLEQFNGDRTERIRLDFTPQRKKHPSLEALPSVGELQLKISSTALSEVADDAPQLVKRISAGSLLEHDVQLILNLPFSSSTDSSFSRDDVVELIRYFAEHDGCSSLIASGQDDFGNQVKLDFGNVFYHYRTEVTMRTKYLEEELSLNVLKDSLAKYVDEHGSIL